ncbi:MAG: hypothetical protein LBU32_32200 [Clostridiales bacterium]|jgi:hypothetical protein|nr:hypothetical protein [Clostridiales bacterium]
MEGTQYRKKAPAIYSIVLLLFTALCVFALIYGEYFAKKWFPERFLAPALLKLKDDIPEIDFKECEFFHDILKGPWIQSAEATLTSMTVNKPGKLLWLDESALRLFKLLSAKLETRVDPIGSRVKGDLSLNMNESKLLDLSACLTQAEIAFKFSQLTDYYVRMNPKEFAIDWNKSLFSQIKEIEGDEADEKFHSKYLDFIEIAPQTLERFSRKWESDVELESAFNGAEIDYSGKVEYPGRQKKVDEYIITLSKDSINEFYRAVAGGFVSQHQSSSRGWQAVEDLMDRIEGFEFTENGIVTILAAEEEVLDILFDFPASNEKTLLSRLKGKIELKGENGRFNDIVLQIEASEGADLYKIDIMNKYGNESEGVIKEELRITVDDANSGKKLREWALILNWDRPRQSSNFSMKLDLDKKEIKRTEWSINGNVKMDEAGKTLEADLDSLKIKSTDPSGELFADLKLKYYLSADKDQDFLYDSSGAANIYDVSEADLLDMQFRIMENDALRSVLNNEF